MHIEVSTDNTIQGAEDVRRTVTEVLESKLAPLASRITRIEAHISDENADKGGAADKRCVLEARVRGREPVVVRHNDETVRSAIIEAGNKLRAALDREIGKLDDRN
ncbi:hypothetical protein C2I36_07310 [Rhodobacteraceae bacterium WD3A24]|nr:hypothetical protein C2I36_07310 [Rhodobacteraceae bacterium WD3A24]